MRVVRPGLVLTIPTLMILAALSGCMTYEGDGTGGGEAGEGNVAFYVKDAPADDFVSVFVTFNEVKVHRAGGGEDGDDGLTTVPNDDLSTIPNDDLSTVPHDDLGDDGSGAGWFTIFSGNETIDLKQFQGDARAFLGEATIAAGKYTQIRIMVTDIYGEDAAGARTDFKLPSDTLKIVRPWTVVDGEETVLVVDWDLDESIIKTGNAGYLMKPVLKLTIENGASDAADAEGADQGGADEDEEQGGKPTDPAHPANSRKP